MIRAIVEVAEDTITLKLPEDLIGKKVEVIAFEIEETQGDVVTETLSREQKLEDIHEQYDKLPRISHEHYKFDRDEANNFDEISPEEIQEIPLPKKGINQLNAELEGLTVNLKDFKFDRNEANNYD